VTAENGHRPLTDREKAQAERVFLGSVRYDGVRIYNGRWMSLQPDDTAMAPNGHVYFPPPIFKEDFGQRYSDMALLIHELTHVWQIQHGVWLKVRRVLVEGGVYRYGRPNPAQLFDSYTVEQQASIVEDWYRLANGLVPRWGTGSMAEYAALVRQAIPGRP